MCPKGQLRHMRRARVPNAGESERVLHQVERHLDRLTYAIPMAEIKDIPLAYQRQVTRVLRTWIRWLFCLGNLSITSISMVPPPKISFLATLNLPDLSKLINDLIRHSPIWPLIPTRLPSDIPKFKGKANKDPNTHVMTFHLWCCSNSLMDDNVRLRLFQRTLMGAVTKWYIELPSASFAYFGTLANAFLHHFQLPI
jgi:hypothetical protein